MAEIELAPKELTEYLKARDIAAKAKRNAKPGTFPKKGVVKKMSVQNLEIWTVYDSPTDFPGLFVARKWLIKQEPVATEEAFTGPTLQSVRDQIPAGLHRIPRAPEDDLNIVESWL